jgi:integrase
VSVVALLLLVVLLLLLFRRAVRGAPRREEAERQCHRSLARKSKETPSQAARRAAAKIRTRKRAPADRYTTGSFAGAVGRAYDAAGAPRWGVNRLRHSRATERRVHGLDTVATILGHRKLETAQIHSEKNLAGARELVAKVG